MWFCIVILTVWMANILSLFVVLKQILKEYINSNEL